MSAYGITGWSGTDLAVVAAHKAAVEAAFAGRSIAILPEAGEPPGALAYGEFAFVAVLPEGEAAPAAPASLTTLPPGVAAALQAALA